MLKVWKAIDQRLTELGAMEAVELRPSASDSDIEELEKHLGVSLPNDFVEFLKTHDGQEDTGIFMTRGGKLLSTREIADAWDEWRWIANEGIGKESEPKMRSLPPNTIKSLYSNTKWIPFASDSGGNHWAFDFDPAPEGNLGQIITFGPDADPKIVVSESFSLLCSKILADLDKMNWDGEFFDIDA